MLINKKEPKINIDTKKAHVYKTVPKKSHKKNPKRANISNVWFEVWGKVLRF